MIHIPGTLMLLLGNLISLQIFTWRQGFLLFVFVVLVLCFVFQFVCLFFLNEIMDPFEEVIHQIKLLL